MLHSELSGSKEQAVTNPYLVRQDSQRVLVQSFQTNSSEIRPQQFASVWFGTIFIPSQPRLR